MFWWCIIMPSCSCYQSMDMLLFELYIHLNDAFFSSAEGHNCKANNIFMYSWQFDPYIIKISLGNVFKIILHSTILYRYTNESTPMTFLLYNSQKKNIYKKLHRCHFRFWLHCFVYFRNQWILVRKLYRSLHLVNKLKAKKNILGAHLKCSQLLIR